MRTSIVTRSDRDRPTGSETIGSTPRSGPTRRTPGRMHQKTFLRRLSLVAVAAAIFVAGSFATAAAQTKPFDPTLDILPADRTADEPVQVQIYFELKDGNSFVKTASFRIPNEYQITPSDQMPNGDIIGDGSISLKVGSLGQQNPNLCLSNKSPNLPGAYSTINVAVQIGGGGPGCSGIFSLTLSLKKFDDGYGFDFTLPPDLIGQKLETPLTLIINLYSLSKANTAANPPTGGGTAVIKNPKEPGSYEWRLAVESQDGQKKDLTKKATVEKATKSKQGTGGGVPLVAIIGGVVALVVVIALIAFFVRRGRKRRMAPAYAGQEYGMSGDEYYPYEYDEEYYEPAPHEGAPPGQPPASAPTQPTGAPEPVGAGQPPPPAAAPTPSGGYDPNAVDHGSEGGTFGSHGPA